MHYKITTVLANVVLLLKLKWRKMYKLETHNE